jgi:hypothetical protein
MAYPTAVKSPFPGMDPYLQAHWSGVHTRLMTYAADALQPQLPGDLVARVEENVRLDADDELLALRSPDVFVAETDAAPIAGTSALSTAITQPIVLEIAHDPIIDRHIEIRDSTDGKVITAIEFLSPWNKSEGTGKNEYLKKREQYLHSEINLVEVDLVRGGKWYLMIPPYRVPRKYRSTYRATVKRAALKNKLELYPIPFAAALPAIHIPLRAGEKDITLNLQDLIDQVYRNGGFGRTDYSKPCEPPFDDEEAKIAAALLPLRKKE